MATSLLTKYQHSTGHASRQQLEVNNPDPLGRVTQVTAPNTGTVGYGYTARGERSQLTYPDGTVVDYRYLADGRLDTVTEGSTTLADYGYDGLGRLDQATMGNGAVTSYTYDNADRLRDLHTTVGGSTVTRFEYDVDRLGLRTQATETLSGTVRTIDYTYDGLLRLTDATETPGTSYTYSYDRVGNRTDGGRTYNAANEVVGFTYDAVGNLLDDGSTSYAYDALGRLTQQGSTSYTYNGDGVLVGRGSTSYTQDLVAPLEQVLNDGTTNAIYGLTRIRRGNSTWYQHDGLGSVRAVLDGAGAVQTTTSYDPWGTTQTALTDSFGFTGELHDGDLVHLRARWYHPSTGTFTSRDPFAGFDTLPYSLHPYQYAYSNPVLLTDPSGESPKGFVKPLEGIYIGALIAAAFIAEQPGNRWAEYPVPGASTGPYRGVLDVNGFADMVDFVSGEVYEVKSRGVYRSDPSAAVKQLEDYIQGLRVASSQPLGDENYRAPPASGRWVRGRTFLAGEVRSFGLWPYGIDKTYDPAQDGYYEIKASQSPHTGIIIFWSEKISDRRARQLAPRYDPVTVTRFIESVYRDPYGKIPERACLHPTGGNLNGARIAPNCILVCISLRRAIGVKHFLIWY